MERPSGPPAVSPRQRTKTQRLPCGNSKVLCTNYIHYRIQQSLYVYEYIDRIRIYNFANYIVKKMKTTRVRRTPLTLYPSHCIHHVNATRVQQSSPSAPVRRIAFLPPAARQTSEQPANRDLPTARRAGRKSVESILRAPKTVQHSPLCVRKNLIEYSTRKS